MPFRPAVLVSIACLAASAVRAEAGPERLDHPGGPLPKGAVARVGAGRPRPDGSITCVALSPDGGTLASLIRLECVVRLWEANTGRPCGEIDGYKATNGALYAMALAPTDPPLLVLQGEAVDFWDIRTGQLQKRLGGRQPRADALATADAGRLLIRGEWDGGVGVQDADRGTVLRRFRGGDYGEPAVAPSADGKILASAGGWLKSRGPPRPAGVKVWDVAGGREHPAFRGKEIPGTCVALTPDGTVLATGGSGDEVQFWDTRTGRELRRGPRRAGRASALAFAPDGRTLAEGREDGTVRLLETATGGERRAWAGHRGAVTSLSWSADGRLLASGGRDATAIVWDVTGRCPEGRWQAQELTAAKARSHWEALAGDDGAAAHHAIWALAAAPRQTVPLMRQHLLPAARRDAKRLPQLLADLDTEDFKAREAAARALEELGEAAEPALRKVLAGKPSLEVRRRLEPMVKKLESWPAFSPAALRDWRALEVLEHLGTPEARQWLQRVAEGFPDARRTREAKASLSRLDARRRESSP